jgi:hypothetical protein
MVSDAGRSGEYDYAQIPIKLIGTGRIRIGAILCKFSIVGPAHGSGEFQICLMPTVSDNRR